MSGIDRSEKRPRASLAPRAALRTALALGTAGLAWALVSTAGFPLTTLDPRAGRRVFVERCADCHSVDAPDRMNYGPDLAEVAQLAGTRRRGLSAEAYLVESILRPADFRAPGLQGTMPEQAAAGLSSRQLANLVAYLMSRDGALPARSIQRAVAVARRPPVAKEPQFDFAEAEAGRQLYFGRGQCAACHPLQALPGFDLVAPSLLAAGRHSRAWLEQAITSPDHELTAHYETWQAVLRSGQVIAGRRFDREQGALLLLADHGSREVWRIVPDDLEPNDQGKGEIHRLTRSAMPRHDALSAQDRQQLVTFLRTLRY